MVRAREPVHGPLSNLPGDSVRGTAAKASTASGPLRFVYSPCKRQLMLPT
jgi:hypothetical protein